MTNDFQRTFVCLARFSLNPCAFIRSVQPSPKGGIRRGLYPPPADELLSPLFMNPIFYYTKNFLRSLLPPSQRFLRPALRLTGKNWGIHEKLFQLISFKISIYNYTSLSVCYGRIKLGVGIAGSVITGRAVITDVATSAWLGAFGSGTSQSSLLTS